MNIEIVEFYSIEKDDNREILKGTLHVYLVDLGIDLRGIYVQKRKNYWRFDLPSRSGVDQETKQLVRYPCFSFMDKKKTDQLLSLIRELGREYILKQLAG